MCECPSTAGGTESLSALTILQWQLSSRFKSLGPHEGHFLGSFRVGSFCWELWSFRPNETKTEARKDAALLSDTLRQSTPVNAGLSFFHFKNNKVK